MPGRVDPNQVSSNWKKLQETLQVGKKKANKPEAAAGESHGVKRKRSLEQKTPAHPFKKTKVLGARPGGVPVHVKRKMGSSESRSTEATTSTPNSRSKLAKQYDIPAEDISAAYGSALNDDTTLVRSKDDEVNSGLHPSRKAGKYIALDCEMVGTGPPPHADNLLARASLVNFHGEQIYDSYVLPPNGVKVEDYRTHVSGIQPRHLSPNVARSFAQVQKDVAALMDGRILVGHALRNDLQVLLLSHPKRDLRDTSRYAKFRIESKGKPPALRNLVKSELGLRIQVGEHSSVEDAKATMLLFKKEKVGFEEENRKQFGKARREVVRKEEAKMAAEDGSIGDDDEEDEEADDNEDDLDLLDGEDPAGGGTAAPSLAKKKRKKKKRTKRR